MVSAVYLSEAMIRSILLNLTKDEITAIQTELEKSLSGVTLGNEGAYQPEASHANRPNGQRTLFRPFTSPTSVGTKIIVEPAPGPSGERKPIHGIVAVCDQNGLPTGILGAEELTGFRTALSAMVPYTWRRRTAGVLVFGAGMQALWHIRLALALRGSEIESITVVNRSVGRAQGLLERVQAENKERWSSKCEFHCLDPNSPDYDSELGMSLSSADVIFCTVASTELLFEARLVTQARTDENGPFLSAVGSWQSTMIELDPAILQHAANLGRDGKPGAVIADDRDSSLKNSGEVVQSGIGAEDVVEVAEALEVRKGTGSDRQQLRRALEEGFLVYKSIGVSVTDLSVANAILEVAKRKGLGVPLQ